MNRKTCVFTFMLFFLLALFVQAGETILIKNGTIVPVVGNTIQKGSILIENGKIVKIGANISVPSGAKVIDASGKYVYPGLVALMTSIGVTGYPGAGDDVNELGVTTPHVDPYDAINPEDSTIDVTRIDGVTTVMTVSGSMNIINGKSVVLNLAGNLADEMVIKRYVAQIFNMGAKGQSMFGPSRPGFPTTLPGVLAIVRDKLNKAKQYAEKMKKSKEAEKKGEKKKGEEKQAGPAGKDLAMEALVPVVAGKVPAIFLTYNSVTIKNALQVIEEYELKGIIHAIADILPYAQELAAKKIPVIWGGTMNIPSRWQPFDLNYHTAAVLAEKGVLFAFDQLGFGTGSHNVRCLPVPAAMSVAHGLSQEEALKAITINPAKIIGIDDMVGSLGEGKMANVVIWEGDPLQMRSRINTVIIDGKVIPLTSFQTRLRDKFDKIVRERMKRKKN